MENGKVKVYRYGRKHGKEYTVSIKAKNCLERLTSSKDVQEIPNIVLTRRFRGMKLVFTKAEASQYKFTLVTWFIPFGVGAKSMYYAAQSVVQGFTARVGNSNA
jgi:uncharacterized protein (DUF849 family)